MSRAWAVALAVALAGCREHPRVEHRVRERAEAMREALIPDAPVRGSLGGRDFALGSAWLRVERRAGQERVDLVLSEGRVSRLCTRPTPDDARQVVVRLRGATELPAGTLRIDADDGAQEVFAEHRGEHGFEGARGSALLVVTRSPAGDVSGKVRACIADAQGSCVGGTFRASVCWDELDLDGPRGARDRPGDGGAR